MSCHFCGSDLGRKYYSSVPIPNEDVRASVCLDCHKGAIVGNKTEIPDYSEEFEEHSEDKLDKLRSLVVEMAKLSIEKEDLEVELKNIKKQITEYEQNLIPELMSDIGLQDLRTKSGIRVEMREEIRASFPKDPVKRDAAFTWLRATGNDGIVKRQFVIQYGRDSTEWADKLITILEENDVDEHASVEHGETIHAGTLKKFLKDQLSEGTEPPLEAFGAFVQKFARIKR